VAQRTKKIMNNSEKDDESLDHELPWSERPQRISTPPESPLFKYESPARDKKLEIVVTPASVCLSMAAPGEMVSMNLPPAVVEKVVDVLKYWLANRSQKI